MRVRSIGLALTLVLVVAALAAGAGLLGYRQAHDDRPSPSTFAAEPVPAASPSYPVTPARVVGDDGYPALEPGVALHPVRLGTAPFQARVPVPRGWVRSDSTAGEWKWFPAEDAMKNIYFIRIRLVGANYASVPAALDSRVAALDGAEGVDDFVVVKRRPSFVLSTYVADEHRRVSYEGFVARAGVAYVSVAVIGREADREGLADLFRRIMGGTRTDLG